MDLTLKLVPLGLTPLSNEDIERYRRKRRLDLYAKKIWRFYSFDKVALFFLVSFILLNVVVLYQAIMDKVIILDEIIRIATYTIIILCALIFFVFPLGFIVVKHKYRISTKVIIFHYLKDLFIAPVKHIWFISIMLGATYASVLFSSCRLMSAFIDLQYGWLEGNVVYLSIGVTWVGVFVVLGYLIYKFLKQMHSRWIFLEFKDFNIMFLTVILFSVFDPVVLLFKFFTSNVQKDPELIWLQINTTSFYNVFIIMYFIFFMYDSKTIHAYQKKYRSLFKKIY